MVTMTHSAGFPTKILLATDLTARCDRAFDRAKNLAEQWESKLVIVHALNSAWYAADAGPSWRHDDPAELAAWRIRHEMLDVAPAAEMVVEKSEPADLILRTAKELGCDLIVTGIASDEFLTRFILGNTVDSLLRRARVPILVVRKRGLKPYLSIVAATDFSEPSLHSLEIADRMFPGHVPTLFHAYDAPVSDRGAMREQFRDLARQDCEAFIARASVPGWRGTKPEVLLDYGAPEALLFDLVRDRNIDLVVLGTHGRTGLANIFLGSTARSIVPAMPCDTLVVRAPFSACETA
jgi:nucleotide-binding universal stress UspA family protein